MTHTSKKLDNSQIELTITVLPNDYQPHLKKAAHRLSERKAIKGFRNGKAPFDIVKKEMGDMAILQEALEDIVKQTFYDALKAEAVETIGMPQISVEKLAPDNDVVYKAVVALLPKVQLPKLTDITVKREAATIDQSKIEETFHALRGMHATEIPKDGIATDTDKLVVNMQMFLDNIPVEGGQANDHQVYLSEKHYIPGFEEQLKGSKKGDVKKFQLDFPETHYQKNLAGKKVDFTVTVKDVYERQLPELSDDLAKKVGQDSIEKLRELITNNMDAESKQKADQKVEIEILDALIDKSTFDPIPQVLIDAERQKMFYELQRDLDRNGVTIEQYLGDIKKTEQEIFEDFKAQAEKRAKAALISRQVAQEQSIVVGEEELDAEMKKLEEAYKGNQEYMDNLKKPGVRESVATTMQNRKVMEWLKEQVLMKD